MNLFSATKNTEDAQRTRSPLRISAASAVFNCLNLYETTESVRIRNIRSQFVSQFPRFGLPQPDSETV
ncbi:MAG: hypothetical protein B6245_15635, partial [Desulfobacteraceae bacterium 4572_88]